MNKFLQELVDLLKDDLANEYHHMHFYLWASAVVSGLHREEMSEFFKDAAKSEMEHICEFSHILNGFGVLGPTIFKPVPAMGTSPEILLNYACQIENQVVEHYNTRIQQAENIATSDGKFIAIFLENQLLDSKNDAIHMTMMLKGC